MARTRVASHYFVMLLVCLLSEKELALLLNDFLSRAFVGRFSKPLIRHLLKSSFEEQALV